MFWSRNIGVSAGKKFPRRSSRQHHSQTSRQPGTHHVQPPLTHRALAALFLANADPAKSRRCPVAKWEEVPVARWMPFATPSLVVLLETTRAIVWPHSDWSIAKVTTTSSTNHRDVTAQVVAVGSQSFVTPLTQGMSVDENELQSYGDVVLRFSSQVEPMVLLVWGTCVTLTQLSPTA